MAGATVKEFFESLEAKLNQDPSRLAGLNAVYQFAIGDERYHVGLKEGKASVGTGETASAQCTVTMAGPDFLDMIAGKLNPQMAFMTGKLKVAGDMGLALKLGSLIKV